MEESGDHMQPAPASAPPPPQTYALESDEAGLSLLDLWKIVSEQKILVALFVLVFVVGATAGAFLKTPKYRSEALLEVVVSGSTQSGLAALSGQFGGLAALTGINFGGGNSKASALAVLKSRNFIEGFIKDQELMPVLFASDWDADKKRWNVSNIADTPTMWSGVKRFRNKIMSVSEDRRTGLVKLGVTWTDPVLAARWVELLVIRVNRNLREQSIQESSESIEFLNAELAKTQFAETRQAISSLLEQLINKIMMANVRDEFAFKVLDPPAVSPDDEFVEPNRLFWVVFGFFLGGILGTAAAFARHVLATKRT